MINLEHEYFYLAENGDLYLRWSRVKRAALIVCVVITKVRRWARNSTIVWFQEVEVHERINEISINLKFCIYAFLKS